MNRNSVVHKFLLNPPSDAETMIGEVEMTAGARIINLGIQNNRDAVLWAVLDPKETHKVTRRFQVVPTGIPFEARASSTFIGTFQVNEAPYGRPERPLVFHVFEIL